MTKKILFSILAIALMVACNNQKSEEVTNLTTAEFATKAPELLDKTVSIEGTVMHVCQHGGKKFFLNDDRVKIVVSEKIASFDQELVGSDVVVKGIVKEELVNPVLSEEADMKHKGSEEGAVKDEDNDNNESEAVTEAAEDHSEAKEEKAEGCDMEKDKHLYVIEVLEVTEKQK